MRLLESIRDRIANLFQRSAQNNKMNSEMEEELRSHIVHRADDLERAGLARAEAERRARVEFGGYERYRQDSYEAAGNHFFERLLQDVRFGLRVLAKSPGFTIVAVLTLALAIGANAVVFSMLNGLVLRPLNVAGAKSLAIIERGDGTPIQSYPDYLDLRERNRSFDDLMAYQITRAGLNTGHDAAPAWLYEASGNYFDVLGIEPYLGRFFHTSDEHGENSSPYIVLSYAYWESRFDGDRAVVGRTVQLNKHPYTILGVAPQNFYGTELFYAPDFWVPLVDQGQVDGWSGLKSRGNRDLEILGHLKPDVTPAQASADLNSIGAYLSKAYPKDDDGMTFKLARPGLVGDMLGKPVRAFLAGLMALAALILLAACRPRGGPVERDRAAAGAGIEPQTHSPAAVHGSGDGVTDGRRRGISRQHGAAAMAERVAAGVKFSYPRAGESGCTCVWSGSAAGVGERPTLRRGPGAPGTARESL
jgi:hypothetical protein